MLSDKKNEGRKPLVCGECPLLTSAVGVEPGVAVGVEPGAAADVELWVAVGTVPVIVAVTASTRTPDLCKSARSCFRCL